MTSTTNAAEWESPTARKADLGFVAINYITVQPHYRDRFEELFSTRAGAIDRLPGFLRMHVLRPNREGAPYLIESHWTDEDAFQQWMKSPEFMEGHRRGFADLAEAKARGEEPPMSSDFVTYSIVTE
jgi:heme-degrading monooxygenase HmoA